MWPTAPITAVRQMSRSRVALDSDTLPEATGTPRPAHAAAGQVSAPRVALYGDALPETTGTPSASQAAAIPAIVRSSCQAPSGRSGLPRLRQSVIALGSGAAQAAAGRGS